jgi:glycosyltransferase involved in cell wall biosynthesis
VPRRRPLHVLIAHNRYRSHAPSGENDVVDSEVRLLREAGLRVSTLITDSDTITQLPPHRKAAAAVGPLLNPFGVADMRTALAGGVDIVHLHNPYPLLSPWVVRAAHDAAIPVVQTVHNYRHVCMAATLRRNDEDCFKCVGRSPLPGVMHGCYRGSRLQSLSMGTGMLLHRSTWASVDRFLALSEYMRAMLVRGGLPAARISVRPTWVYDPGKLQPPGPHVLFVGRLDHDKGVLDLLEGWKRVGDPNRRLRIVGDGPLLEEVRKAASSSRDVDVVGRLSGASLAEEFRNCALLVVPSRWPEGVPRVLIEAFSHGRPVIASDVGSLAEVVTRDVGWTCNPAPINIAETLREAFAAPKELAAKGAAARRRYVGYHSPEQATRSLLEAYSCLDPASKAPEVREPPEVDGGTEVR